MHIIITGDSMSGMRKTKSCTQWAENTADIKCDLDFADDIVLT